MPLFAAPSAARVGNGDSSNSRQTREWGSEASPDLLGPGDDPQQASHEELRLQPESLIPGSRIVVEAWLGDGATSDVYRGRHVDLGRKIAIKVLRHVDSPEDACERFLAEARFISALRSDYIVGVTDFGSLPDGRPYYAMEYLEGISLDEALAEGAMPIERAIRLLRMACKALRATHEAGIIHRDIKPGNLLVVPRPGGERLVLVDFGVAVIHGLASKDIAGTPHTMAPEQIEGLPVDPRTDIYGLGCCGHEMLTGEPLAPGSSIATILDFHLDPKRTPIDPRHGIPRPLASVIERCVAHDAEQRFASAADLEAALCDAQIEITGATAGQFLETPAGSEDRRLGIAAEVSGSQYRARLRLRILLAAAALCVVVALGGWLRARASAADDDRFLVEVRADHARVAADDRRFVYPPPDASKATETAYEDLQALEAWNGPARADAIDHAARLRVDLGEVLLARGDLLWMRPSGRGPARDYYAQALIFDPGLARARERLGMTAPELAEQRGVPRQVCASSPRDGGNALLAAEGSLPASEATIREPAADAGPGTPFTPFTPFTRTLDSAPAASSGQETKRVAVSRQAQRAPRAAQKMVRRAEHKMAAGDRAGAREAYLAAIELDGRNAEAYGGLADVHFQQGRHEQALRYATMAVQRAPGAAHQHLRLADSSLRTGHPERARHEYERAAALGSTAASGRLAALKGTP